MSETRATEAELTRSYYDASDARTKRMIMECDHEEAALEEARSILADVEPSDRGIFRSVRFLNAESGRMWAMEYLDERLALAESLRSFVEGC